jgi:glucosyl-3-phosphoglycerate synthase
MTPKKIDVVIPTRNDYVFLEKIIKPLLSLARINKIIVVDNCSKTPMSNRIKNICAPFKKCLYTQCSKVGKGNAISTGIKFTKYDILFLDADIENFNLNTINPLLSKFDKGFDMVKANFNRSNGQSNSAFILVNLRKTYPNLNISKPTGGIYILKKEILKNFTLPKLWSIDLSILLQAHTKGFKITEVFIGIITDKSRNKESLNFSKDCLFNELNIKGESNEYLYP